VVFLSFAPAKPWDEADRAHVVALLDEDDRRRTP
jgi:hypothetical protein